MNGNNVIIKPNNSGTLCYSFVSREQRIWDTWSAPSQADAAFPLSGAVFYKLDCLVCLLGLHVQCVCLFSSYKITFPVLHINQGTYVRLRSLHADLVTPCTTCSLAQLWPPVGYTQTWLILCTVADDIKFGCNDPRTFYFSVGLKDCPAIFGGGFSSPLCCTVLCSTHPYLLCFHPEEGGISAARKWILLCSV